MCGGNNDCAGCDGIPNSVKKWDECGVCGGNNSCFAEKKERKNFESVFIIWGLTGIDRSSAESNNVK